MLHYTISFISTTYYSAFASIFPSYHDRMTHNAQLSLRWKYPTLDNNATALEENFCVLINRKRANSRNSLEICWANCKRKVISLLIISCGIHAQSAACSSLNISNNSKIQTELNNVFKRGTFGIHYT